jgi:hypothetical protein
MGAVSTYYLVAGMKLAILHFAADIALPLPFFFS